MGSARGAGAAAEVPVLVVGGSLVGLSTAMFLGWHGIRSVGIERHHGTAIHPRAGHFQLRTLELLRSVGIEDRVRAASEEQFDPNGGIAAVESLAGREIAHYIANLNDGIADVSPTIRLFMTQQRLEPLLRARAEELGADLHFATELIAVEQDADGVTARVREVESGRERAIRAKYLVAADGNRSPVRERLGIAMRGHGLLANSVTIYFTAPECGPLLRDRNLGVIYVFNDTLRGFFRLERSGKSGFLVVFTAGDISRPEATDVASGITEERCIALVRAAAGVPDLDVRIEDIARWRAVADNAERYRDGRIFLVGDAAHTMPPTGGFGGNTGVQDAHNLAWKLALVLRGKAGPELLSTYESERHPVGAVTVEQAYTRYVLRVAPHLRTADMAPLADDLTTEIGYRYHSSAILAEADHDGAVYEHPRQSRGRPGSRAPHLSLERSGERLSSLDLFGRNFALLAGPDGGAWCDAAREAGRSLGLDIDAYRLGGAGAVADPEGCFAEAYGVSPAGAVLVRPDGFVAWRAKSAAAQPRSSLAQALRTVLHQDGKD